MALEVCRLARLGLDPWQETLLVDSLGEREDGKWSAFEVAEVVPRQNGKGTTLEGRELTGLFAIDEERLLIHSAHEQATSSEHFRRLLNLIESVPDFDQQVLKAPKGKGAEAIELKNGSRILFKTRTGGGGRGLTGDLVVLDEAMILPKATTAALVPTMAARSVMGNPQLWYAGSAVDQQIHEHGVVLAKVRERALAGAPGLMYVEWSVEGDDPDQVPPEIALSPEAWAQANPGLGIRISTDHVANECGGALGPREFAVERLGVGDWPQPDLEDADSVISRELWDTLTDAESIFDGQPCFAVDVRPDWSAAAISAAGNRPDGRNHVEIVDHRPGAAWVIPRLIELQAKHDPIAILFQEDSAAAGLVKNAVATGLDLEPMSGRDFAEACGQFLAAVEQDGLRHRGNPALIEAIRGAVTRPRGEGWVWSRRLSRVDITTLVSSVIALWGLDDAPGGLVMEVYG